MKMPSEILTRLLKGGHINVVERKKLGLSSVDVLKYEDVLRHLEEILSNGGWFPFDPNKGNLSATVTEGIFIYKKQSDSYECTVKRSRAENSNVVTEEKKMIFKSAGEAAAYYLKWELSLPGKLDSFRVE